MIGIPLAGRGVGMGWVCAGVRVGVGGRMGDRRPAPSMRATLTRERSGARVDAATRCHVAQGIQTKPRGR